MGLKKLAYRTIETFGLPFLGFLYHIQVEGRENLPEGKAIIAFNHTSNLDGLVIKSILPKIYFITKRFTLEDPKMFARLQEDFLNSLGHIVLAGNIKMSREEVEKTLEVLNIGNHVGIFPEGQRTYNGKLNGFRKGAAFLAKISDSPLVPAGIIGAYKIWPRSRKIPKISGDITLRIGHPLAPSDYNTSDHQSGLCKLTEKLREEISKLI